MRKQTLVSQYFCDHCNKELSNNRHLLIENATRLGFVSPPNWQVRKLSRRRRRTYQFCDARCFSAFVGDHICGF